MFEYIQWSYCLFVLLFLSDLYPYLRVAYKSVVKLNEIERRQSCRNPVPLLFVRFSIAPYFMASLTLCQPIYQLQQETETFQSEIDRYDCRSLHRRCIKVRI